MHEEYPGRDWNDGSRGWYGEIAAAGSMGSGSWERIRCRGIRGYRGTAASAARLWSKVAAGGGAGTAADDGAETAIGKAGTMADDTGATTKGTRGSAKVSGTGAGAKALELEL